MREEKEESEEKKGKCGETVSEGTCDLSHYIKNVNLCVKEVCINVFLHQL